LIGRNPARIDSIHDHIKSFIERLDGSTRLTVLAHMLASPLYCHAR
jgi:hypothetical protein